MAKKTYFECSAMTLAKIVNTSSATMTITSLNENTGVIKVELRWSSSNSFNYKINPSNDAAYDILYQQAMEQKIRKEMQTHNSDYGYAPRREAINHYKCR